jgi:hypothetical protein
MSFFSSIKNFFVNLWRELTGSGASSLLHEALVAINVTEPLLVLAVTDADPAAAAGVKSVVDEIRTDMTTLSNIIAANATNTESVSVQSEVLSGLTKIAANIGPLLDAGHVKNTNLRNEIVAGVNEIQAVIAALTGSVAAASAPAQTTAAGE